MARPEGAKATIPSRRAIRRYSLLLQQAAAEGDKDAMAHMVRLRLLSEALNMLCPMPDKER